MFTKYELEIMTLLWRENRSFTVNEIIELTPNKSWKPNTIQMLIKNLLEKDAIEIEGFSKSSLRHYSRTFRARISQEEYAATHLSQVLPNMNVAGIVSAMANKQPLSKESLDELSLIIEKIREKQGG